MSRQLPVRVEPTVLGAKADALEIQRGDATRFVRRHLPADPGEGSGLAEFLDERLAVSIRTLSELAAEHPGRPLRLIHFRGNGNDRVRVDAVGEHPSAPIEDLSTLGGHLDGSELLVLGAGEQHVMLDDLEVDQTPFDCHRPHGNRGRSHQHAPMDDATPIGWRWVPLHSPSGAVPALAESGPEPSEGLSKQRRLQHGP